MSTINVYIITDGKSGKDVSRLSHLFHHNMFNVMEAVVPQITVKVENKEMSQEDLYGIYQVQWCLEQSRNAHPNRPVLVIRDSSISLISSDKLQKLMCNIINDDNQFDMFYLCRWNDHCQKHIDIKEYEGIKVARTYAANGTQAIYFSVSGRDIFLGRRVMRNDRYLKFHKSLDRRIYKELVNGNIISYCTLHNIFDYDITRATSNTDYNKISPCMVMTKGTKINTGTNLGYLWFVIIVILVIVLAFAIARIGK